MFTHGLMTPVLGIDRDLDNSQRLLTRRVLGALSRLSQGGREGATRAELQAELSDDPDAKDLVPSVLAEALYDELVDVAEPTNPDATWALNSRGLERLSSAEAEDSSKRRKAAGNIADAQN